MKRCYIRRPSLSKEVNRRGRHPEPIKPIDLLRAMPRLDLGSIAVETVEYARRSGSACVLLSRRWRGRLNDGRDGPVETAQRTRTRNRWANRNAVTNIARDVREGERRAGRCYLPAPENESETKQRERTR